MVTQSGLSGDSCWFCLIFSWLYRVAIHSFFIPRIGFFSFSGLFIGIVTCVYGYIAGDVGVTTFPKLSDNIYRANEYGGRSCYCERQLNFIEALCIQGSVWFHMHSFVSEFIFKNSPIRIYYPKPDRKITLIFPIYLTSTSSKIVGIRFSYENQSAIILDKTGANNSFWITITKPETKFNTSYIYNTFVIQSSYSFNKCWFSYSKSAVHMQSYAYFDKIAGALCITTERDPNIVRFIFVRRSDVGKTYVKDDEHNIECTKKRNDSYNDGEDFVEGERSLAFCHYLDTILILKYSPNTALTVSGIDSSFLAFLSSSNALTISSDMLTIIFCITILLSPPLDTVRYPYIVSGIYLLVAIGIWLPNQTLRCAE